MKLTLKVLDKKPLVMMGHDGTRLTETVLGYKVGFEAEITGSKYKEYLNFTFDQETFNSLAIGDLIELS